MELTAASIAEVAYAISSRGGVDAVYASGGGVRNATLMVALRHGSKASWARPMRSASRPTRREALAFALLAHPHACGEWQTSRSATGARHAALLGSRHSGARPGKRTHEAVPDGAGASRWPHARHGRVRRAAQPSTREPVFDIGSRWTSIPSRWSRWRPVARVARGGRNERACLTLSENRCACGAQARSCSWRASAGRAPCRSRSSRCRTRCGSATMNDEAQRGRASWWNGKHWRGRFKVFVNARQSDARDAADARELLVGVVMARSARCAIRCSRPDARRPWRRAVIAFFTAAAAGPKARPLRERRGPAYSPVEAERPLATKLRRDDAASVSLPRAIAPIRANYCSTCGGVSAEVWGWRGRPRSYLRSVADRGVGEGTTARCRRSTAGARVDRRGVRRNPRFGPAQKVAIPAAGVGEIVDVEVDARSRSGRVWRLRVFTSTGEIIVPAYSLRRCCAGRERRGASCVRTCSRSRCAATRTGAWAWSSRRAGSGHGVGSARPARSPWRAGARSRGDPHALLRRGDLEAAGTRSFPREDGFPLTARARAAIFRGLGAQWPYCCRIGMWGCSSVG